MNDRLVASCYLCLVVLSTAVHSAPTDDVQLVSHPVLLVPGFAASQMDARLNKTTSPHFYCSRHTDWFRIWFAPTEFLPRVLDCFIDNFRLVFNETTGRAENPAGVETRVTGFGETDGVEFLSSLKFGPANYFHNLVESLVALGYVRGFSVRAAPYDFRHSIYENEEYLANMEKLVEEMYHQNGDKKVILVCHSMGCLYSYYFLRQHDQDWKDRYIQSWITVAAPFGGAVRAVQALTSGVNFHTELFSKSGLRDLERTFSSFSLLQPAAPIYGDNIILSYADVNYTAKDMPLIYKLIGDEAGLRMWEQSSRLIPDYGPPGVETHCLRGKNVPTVERISYPDAASFPSFPVTINGPGDGTVNQISADVCLRWADSSNDFHTEEFENVIHQNLVKHPDVVSYITRQVLHANFDV